MSTASKVTLLSTVLATGGIVQSVSIDEALIDQNVERVATFLPVGGDGYWTAAA